MLETHKIQVRSIRSRLFSQVLRYVLKPRLTRLDFDPARFRNWINIKPPSGVSTETVEAGGVRAEWVRPNKSSSSRCLIYLHGGGYLIGSPATYRRFTARLAQVMKEPVFVPDYRLAPENPFPAAVEDVVAAYRYLLDQGYESKHLVIAGDSAGGGLAFALLHALKQQGLPLPAAQITLSPYTDLNASGVSVRENSDSCVMFNAECISQAAAMYLNGADPQNPLASPLYGEFSGFPPQLMYVSDSEVLRDDGLRLAEKLGEAGVPVHLNLWHGQPHVWPVFYPLLPEADVCIREMAAFAGQYW